MIQYLIHFQDPLHAELTAANVKKLKIDILLRTSLDELIAELLVAKPICAENYKRL